MSHATFDLDRLRRGTVAALKRGLALLEDARGNAQGEHALTPAEERELAREAMAERGFHLTLRERSKRAYELGAGAPRIRHVPPRRSAR